MNRFILLLFFALLLTANTSAQEVFTLVSREKKTVSPEQLIALTKERTVGKKEGTNLEFTEKQIRLIVLTGPLDDMFSYRIQGMRNPTLVAPVGAELKILFVNMDIDMLHDLKFGRVVLPFPAVPDISRAAGTETVPAESATNVTVIYGEEVVIRANTEGLYKYFCSVRGHAGNGMWGNIAVGVSPGKDLVMPEKKVPIVFLDETDEPAHDHGKMQTPAATPTPPAHEPDLAPATTPTPAHQHTEEPKKDPAGMPGMDHGAGGHKEMTSTVNIGDPMNRESSGTAWAPDSSPVYARMKMYGYGGMLMLMGSAFVRYTRVGSSRDVSAAGKGSRQRFDAPSMLMVMYSRPVGERSQFGFRTMVSLDPIIQRGYGYPLLYQSGEVFHGQPIHDRQHPHDFISELAVSYSYKFNEKTSGYLYAGYPGEPALGPPTFVHRASAANNPDAPISHHWQDATHITWGVITGGLSFGKFKLEASVFRGEEPNENRWDFDRPRLDSFSGRFSWNPDKNWAFQISHGYLKNPEPSEPGLKVFRKTTASAIYNKRFSDGRNWASTFVWGQNYGNGERTNSFLFESNYDFDKNAVFGRVERVQKSGHDLALDPPDEHEIFRVGAYSAGYARDIFGGKGIDVGLGGMVTLNQNPAALVPYYGGTSHTGYQVFLRIRPSKME